MFNKKYICQYIFLVLSLCIFSCCEPEEDGDKVAPSLMTSTPADGVTSVDVNTIITLQFTEKINLSSTVGILLNNVEVSAVAVHKNLTIDAVLLPNTSYTLLLPYKSIYDDAGNYSEEITVKFTTAASATTDGTKYEAEDATLSGGAATAADLTGYSGTGYVNTNAGNVLFNIQADVTGYYDLALRYSTSNSNKVNDLYIDGKSIASLTFDATADWKTMSAGKIKLVSGSHTISVVKNWGYVMIDYMTLAYDADGLEPFNIAPVLVTPNPSAQAVNLYNYLKSSFGTKVISGTMANHSTNIDEAIWVNGQTGKWPALTCFDFIDHTNLNQNWIKYSAPFTLGKDWWNNNGIVALMWHWRDPLTKTGSFYTSETTFDVSKVTDTTSVEYKAIIVDLDTIAGYLKEFKNAGIPVIWRPLHEAAGKWFWWGAKGAAPCKALWKLMFDRFVNHHGLNNLIWVWTTDATEDALNWYPGDDYVDILGMDIYPGENQHGSQYFSYNKIKELYGGRKIITLSECGSVPDPGQMKDFGDMWSYFMPWNSDYTKSASHNGPTWWNTFFSYDFVVTRDKMPNLK